ncbi:MAG: biotin/lipoyl-binding protein [Planctomycetota bacterium]|nr:MAG: biotin/lipoyl-binding protein [Planctomycetota bacterium]
MAKEFVLPNLGENVESGDVVNILVSEGDVITGNQGVIELETDKAVLEIPCPIAGKIEKIHVSKGDTVSVGQTILTVEPEAGEAEDDAGDVSTEAAAEEAPASPPPFPTAEATPPTPQPASAPVSPAAPPAVPTRSGPIPAGPAARRLARELGVDLQSVTGTGKHGRITPEDVQAAAQGKNVGVAAAGPVVPPGEPDTDAWGPVRRDRMTKIRKTIAAQMMKSWTTVPRVTNFDDADVTDLEAVRKSVPPDFIAPGLKLTSMPFILKAVALALRHHPAVNASIDDENEEIVYKEYVNIGVAVDTPRGLVVPVIRNVDRMSIPQIATAVAEVARKARNTEFTLDDLRGGTFSVSNLGAVGGTYSTPIVNHPEVAILLVGRSRWMPVVRDGQVVPRFMMPLSLSYDHRLVDGATAARFLNEVIDWLQSPGKLLLVG